MEKWKNVKDVLQVENYMEENAIRFNEQTIRRKFFWDWNDQAKVRQSKGQLKLSCYEFYAVSLVKKAMIGFKKQINQKYRNERDQEIEVEILKNQCARMFQKFFITWYLKYKKSQSLRKSCSVIESTKNAGRLSMTFRSLKNYYFKRK